MSAEDKNLISNQQERRLKEQLVPFQTALLVVDMQKGYVDPEAPLPKMLGHTTNTLQAMVEPLIKFIEESRDKGIPVFWTQMEENPEVMAPNMRKKMEDEETVVITKRGEKTYDFYGVSPKEGEVVVYKTHYNAFAETDLDLQLRQRGINTLIITGAYASRCVASTAIAASDTLGYNLIVPIDLVAGDDTMTTETQGFLAAVQAIYGETTNSEHILEILKETK